VGSWRWEEVFSEKGGGGDHWAWGRKKSVISCAGMGGGLGAPACTPYLSVEKKQIVAFGGAPGGVGFKGWRKENGNTGAALWEGI